MSCYGGVIYSFQLGFPRGDSSRSCDGQTSQRLLQLCLRIPKSVALHEFLELRPGITGKQRTERGLVCLDEFHRAGIEFRQQFHQLRRGGARLRGIGWRRR